MMKESILTLVALILAGLFLAMVFLWKPAPVSTPLSAGMLDFCRTYERDKDCRRWRMIVLTGNAYVAQKCLDDYPYPAKKVQFFICVEEMGF